MLWNVAAGANGDVFMLQLCLLVQTQFHLAIETLMYTCGNSVLPEGHPMATVFVLQCPSGKTVLFALTCVRCGNTEPDAPVNEQIKRQYKVVNPVCRVCAENGKSPSFWDQKLC